MRFLLSSLTNSWFVLGAGIRGLPGCGRGFQLKHPGRDHTVKGFSVVNETEVDVFPKFPCFLYEPVNVGNLISGSFVFSKPSLYIWQFMYCWSLACIILSMTLLVWGMNATVGRLSVLQYCPSWELGWRWTFSSLAATAQFSKFTDLLSAAL